jgi:hypothetical protein
MRVLFLLLLLSCARVQESSIGTLGLLSSITNIENTYKTAPVIEMNFQFQKGSGDYLSQKIVTYEFLETKRAVYSTDNGEGITDTQGRYKFVVSTVGDIKFRVLEVDRTPIGSFTTSISSSMKKEDVKMENTEGNLGIQVLSINNNYNQYTTTETVSNIKAPTFLNYSDSNYLFIRLNTIPTLTPTADGTTPLTYSISPPLPSGLSFSLGGVISGTPTTISNLEHTVTVTNSKGSTSTRLRIRVVGCSAGEYYNSGVCSVVGKGYYSTGDSIRRVCTTTITPGSNMEYIRTNSTSPDCEIACADNYYMNAGSCTYSLGAKAMTCNQGYYMVGIYGAAGSIFDSFGLKCGKLNNDTTSEVYAGAKNSYGFGGQPFVALCPNGQVVSRIYTAVGVEFSEQYPLMSQFTFYCKNFSTGASGSAFGPYGTNLGTMVNLVCEHGTYAYGVVSRLANGCSDFTNCGNGNGNGNGAFTGYAREVIGILCK